MVVNDKNNVLAVDLDRTIIKGDLLLISFWSAIYHNPFVIIGCAIKLLTGRAALKKYLAKKSRIDVKKLQYHDFVKEYVLNWKKNVGQVVLVTAADHSLAILVAGHLKIFDEVHASDGQRNLKGKVKANFLCNRYGNKQFTYIGDSWSDLAIWSNSLHAVTVNASPRLVNSVEKICTNFTHLKPRLKSSFFDFF